MKRVGMLTFFFGLLFDAGATDDRNGPKCTCPLFSQLTLVAAKLRTICFLAMSALILASVRADAAEFYVALDGKDTNAGTEGAPFATLTRARDAVRVLKQAGPWPRDGVTVWIREGVYRFDTTLQLGPEDSGAADAPVVYRASVGENVVFDGSRPIDATSWRKVDDASTLARLCPAARGNVLKAVIADESTANALANSGTRLSIDGRMMQLAQFPNVGYCHIGKILDKGAVYAHGRTMGEVPKYSMNAPAARWTRSLRPETPAT